MPRAKRGFKRRQRVNKLLKKSKGFVGAHNQVRRGSEQIDRAFVYAFRDRRVKKRDFRGLWITRIGAAIQEFDISYSRFVNALKKAQVKLDRKVLSDIAITDPAGFGAIVEQVKSLAPKL
jgi:large subunit ribosomal protein L20